MLIKFSKTKSTEKIYIFTIVSIFDANMIANNSIKVQNNKN